MKNVYVNVRDGLGNQWFCYAFGYAVAKRSNGKLILDSSRLDTNKIKDRRFELLNFQIKYDKRISYKYVFNPKLRKWRIDQLFRASKIGIFTKQYVEENAYRYEKEVFEIKNDTYFDGYWQNYRYFDEYRDELIEMFKPSRQISNSMQDIIKEMESCCSVALHVRRGDYVDINWNVPMAYYVKALQMCRECLSDKIRVYLFTDDKEFTKKFFSDISIENLEFVFPEYESNNYIVDDMYLLSKCKHNIIANSSFSWWSAYLNDTPDKLVICPEYSTWTKDFYPVEWKKINVNSLEDS